MRSQLSFEPYPIIKPPSRSRVYLCPFRGYMAYRVIHLAYRTTWFIGSPGL